MPDQMFKLAGRQPVPVPDGYAEAGVETYTVDQVAKRVKWPKQALLALHEAFFPPTEDEEAAAPTRGGLPRSDAAVAAAVERAVVGWQADPAKVLIRAADYGWMADADLALFLVRCAQRGLNAWRREAYPRFRWNERRQRHELVLIVAFEKLNAMAIATGECGGWGHVKYEYGPDGRVTVARVTVMKMVGGVVTHYRGEAWLEEYHPGPGVDEVWDRMPRSNLKRCARADAIRMAWPHLAGLYTSDEFRREGGGGGQPKQVPGRDDGAQPFPDDSYSQV